MGRGWRQVQLMPVPGTVPGALHKAQHSPSTSGSPFTEVENEALPHLPFAGTWPSVGPGYRDCCGLHPTVVLHSLALPDLPDLPLLGSTGLSVACLWFSF